MTKDEKAAKVREGLEQIQVEAGIGLTDSIIEVLDNSTTEELARFYDLVVSGEADKLRAQGRE